MYVPNRLKRIRLNKGLMQRELGVMMGYSKRNAGTRIAQYETGTRSPNEETIELMAEVLGVVPNAIEISYPDTIDGLLHFLFLLEDLHCLIPVKVDGEMMLCFSDDNGIINDALCLWSKKMEQLYDDEIDDVEYDNWRYSYCFT